MLGMIKRGLARRRVKKLIKKAVQEVRAKLLSPRYTTMNRAQRRAWDQGRPDPFTGVKHPNPRGVPGRKARIRDEILKKPRA